MDFGITRWGSSHTSYVNKIFTMQIKAIRMNIQTTYSKISN